MPDHQSNHHAGNSIDPEPTPAPSLRIISHFIRDFSFENPNALNLFAKQDDKPDFKLRLNVQSEGGTQDELHAVTLFLKAEARFGEKIGFIFELAYTGFFNVTEFPDNMKEFVLNTECPRFLFPFARRLTADVIREGGYPPPFLDPIDFTQLYADKFTAEKKAEFSESV